MDKLISMTGATKSGDEVRDVSATALRSVVLEIPEDSAHALTILKRLTPKLVSQLQENTQASDRHLDTLDVLNDELSHFSNTLRDNSLSEERESLKDALVALLPSSPSSCSQAVYSMLGTFIGTFAC